MSLKSSEFEIFKEKRRKDYNTWKPIYSPALGEQIFFNSKGFNHLRFRTDGTPRNFREALYKLRLLPLVRSVIYKARKVDEYRKGRVEYWGIVEAVGKKKIKVILRRIGKGRIHFWSVMRLAYLNADNK